MLAILVGFIIGVGLPMQTSINSRLRSIIHTKLLPLFFTNDIEFNTSCFAGIRSRDFSVSQFITTCCAIDR